MKNQTRLSTVVLVCLLSSATALAVDRNVSNQTQLNSAIAAAAPGDNIILANGTYSGLNIDLTCSGSSTAPITLRAATAGSVTINGDSRVRLAGSYLVVSGLKFSSVDPTSWTNVVLFDNADYSRLTQCAFYQCGKDKWTHIIKVSNGTTNARIDHNYMERNQGQGIGIAHNGGNSDNQIDHNHINRIQGDPALLGIGVKPMFTTTFTPTALASGSATVFTTKSNISPPRDLAAWSRLVTDAVRHVRDQFGADEIATWYFEAWNESNLSGFWSGTQEQRFALGGATYRAVKSVDARLRLGGPSTARSEWLREFLDHTQAAGTPPDYIISHIYNNDSAHGALSPFDGPQADRVNHSRRRRPRRPRDGAGLVDV